MAGLTRPCQKSTQCILVPKNVRAHTHRRGLEAGLATRRLSPLISATTACTMHIFLVSLARMKRMDRVTNGRVLILSVAMMGNKMAQEKKLR